MGLYGKGLYGSGYYGGQPQPYVSPPTSHVRHTPSGRWGVVSTAGGVSITQRLRSGHVDSGVRATAQNEDYRPKPNPRTLFHMLRRVGIERPTEEWRGPQPRTVGSLRQAHPGPQPSYLAPLPKGYGRGLYGQGLYGKS